jgi:predicted RNA binding protein YcfA (HicA-like mRNA interferase family)
MPKMPSMSSKELARLLEKGGAMFVHSRESCFFGGVVIKVKK